MSNGIDEERIKKHMTKCLWSVKNGNAYTMGGLDETDYAAITSVEDELLLKKFFKFVAKSMLGEGKKKKVKRAVADMESSVDTWKEFIIATDAMGEEATMHGMEEDEDKSSSRQKKPSRKRRTSSFKSKPAKKARVKDVNEEETIIYTREQINAERSRFEKEKAEILDSLDDEYKSRFGEICFVKWRGSPDRPVLVCSPYDVSYKTDARRSWMEMHKKVTANNRKRTYLVYWYGSSEKDCYTFQPKGTLMTYEEAKSKGLHKPPKKLLETPKPNATILETLRGYEEYPAHLLIAQDERKPPFPALEKHESMEPQINTDLADDDMDAEDEDEESVVSEEDSVVEEEEPPVKKRGRKKGQKERPKANKSKTKKTKKKRPPQVEESHTDNEENEMDFAEDDVSGTDGNDDDDKEEEDEKDEFEEPPSEEDDDEELDHTYVAESAKPKTKKDATKNGDKLKAKKKRKRKEESEEEDENDAPPAKKKRGRPKKLKPKEGVKKTKLKGERKEQKSFDDCKKNFGELHGQWLSAIKAKHAKKLVKVLQEVERQAEHMSAPYIEKYIAPYLRQTKPLLLEEDKAIEKSTRIALKTVYGEKKAKVPEGFQPKDNSADDGQPGKREHSEEKTTGTPAEKPDSSENASAEVPKNESKKESESKPKSNGHTLSVLSKPPSQEQTSKPADVPESPRKTPQSEQSKSVEKPVTEKTKEKPKLADKLKEKTKLKTKLKEKPKLKKSFSLGGLMRGPRSGATTPVKATLSRQGSSAALDSQEATVTTAAAPKWLKDADPGVASPLEDRGRKLAVEILAEAATYYLPLEKVKSGTFARNLECAIHTWSSDPKRRNGAYWDRLHGIVGGVCGNEDIGRMGKNLLEGKYKTAKALASVSEQEIIDSFKETNASS